MSCSFLIKILDVRKSHFDRVFKKFITPADNCTTLIFCEPEKDEFESLLAHFKEIKKLHREWPD